MEANYEIDPSGIWFILCMIMPIWLVWFDKNKTVWFNSLCL
jgi:hypothetical protein